MRVSTCCSLLAIGAAALASPIAVPPGDPEASAAPDMADGLMKHPSARSARDRDYYYPDFELPLFPRYGDLDPIERDTGDVKEEDGPQQPDRLAKRGIADEDTPFLEDVVNDWDARLKHLRETPSIKKAIEEPLLVVNAPLFNGQGVKKNPPGPYPSRRGIDAGDDRPDDGVAGKLHPLNEVYVHGHRVNIKDLPALTKSGDIDAVAFKHNIWDDFKAVLEPREEQIEWLMADIYRRSDEAAREAIKGDGEVKLATLKEDVRDDDEDEDVSERRSYRAEYMPKCAEGDMCRPVLQHEDEE